MRKLKDRLKERAKKLRQDKPPAPGCQADGHVNDGAGHSAVAIEASGSEGCNHALSSVPDEMQAEQDLWQRAFAMLSEHEKKSLSVLAKNGRPTTKPADDISSVVSSLVTATRQKQEQCEKQFWRINIPGKPGDEIILREQAAQVISWLTKAGDIGMKFAPSLAQEVWPCVKAVLQIPVSEIDQMAALLEVAEKVTRVTARGRVYEACYTVANTPTNTLKMLHEALIAIYKATLMLLSRAAGLLDKNIMKRTVYSILHPDEIKKEAGSDFADLETRLAWDVQAVEAQRSARSNADVLRRLEILNSPVVRIDERVASMLEKVKAEEEQEILDWISSVPHSGHHDTVVENRMDDTCGWLLRHRKFQEWENSSGCSLMWLQGTTGTGKTCLTSKVIDHKQNILGGAPNDEALAFFYFNRTDPSRSSALSCLRSLVRQLSTPRRHQGHIQSVLRELYQDCRRDGRILNKKLCMMQLIHSLNVFPKTTFIVDAVDECNQDDRETLIEVFDELMRASGRPLKVFISGRPEGDIRAALRSRTIVEIGVEDNQTDIARFIEERVQQHRRWDQFDETLKNKVTNTLLQKSHGMFRWTKLQLDQLLTLSLPEDVESRLGKLPRDLKTAYDEMYLTRDGYESRVIDRAIMWMLASRAPVESEDLLSVVRIDPISYVDTMLKPTKPHTEDSIPEDAKYISSEVDEDLLLDLCANLLTLDFRKRWQFCHASVSEYFEDNHFNRLQTHTQAAFISLALTIDALKSIELEQQLGAAKCLWLGEREDISQGRLLLRPRQHGNYLDGSIMNHPLVEYADNCWGDHVMVVERSLGLECEETGAKNHTLATTDDLSALLHKFFGHPNESSAIYRHWLGNMGFIINAPVDWRSPLSHRYASFTMVRFGIFKLLQSWWQDSRAIEEDGKWIKKTNTEFLIDTNVRSERGWSLLAVACHFGHTSIVETLLTAGMKTDEHSKDWNALFYDKNFPPLTQASKQGHVEICKLLIERGGCDPNFPANFGNPLYCAAKNKHPNVLRYLLSAGADPNTPFKLEEQDFGSPGSALVAAACSNDIEALHILVKNGNADPMMLMSEDYHLGSAAVAAAFHGSVEALKYLIIEAHVDANAEVTTGLFRSILIAAAAKSWVDPEILRFLGKHGVNFNVRLRERNGSHIKLQVDDPGTVLEKAVIEGIKTKSESALKILVEEFKAEVNHLSEDGPYGCALAAAQDSCLQFYGQSGRHGYGQHHNRSLQISKWLMKKGANVNLQLPHGRYHSPLAAAAALSDRKNMEYLINEGADVNLELQYGDYGNVLAFAAAGGFLASAQCLIDCGANVNLPLIHGKYRSALMAAAGAGDEDAVQFLINNGADVNQLENHNWEALFLGERELSRNRNILLPSPRYSTSLSSFSLASSSLSVDQCHEGE